jgi:hypothetical protein
VHETIREHWPDAPIVGSENRWAQLRLPDGGVVYIQRNAWDEETRPDYVAAWHHGDAEPRQIRHHDLAHVVAFVRDLCGRALTPR